MQRLDKYLADAGVGTRRELRQLIRSGAVAVNGNVVTDEGSKVAEDADQIAVNGSPVNGKRRVVLLLHKPAGCVTATEDPREPTVMALLPPIFLHWGVAPVGRLDKQTEGLLLLTNDGTLAHRLISPAHAVEKEYYAEHEGVCGPAEVRAFAEGLTLADGTRCRPAVLEPLEEGRCRVTVTEGKYHQVRRMLASVGCPVRYLRREREGGLRLENLPRGQWRELLPEEIKALEG